MHASTLACVCIAVKSNKPDSLGENRACGFDGWEKTFHIGYLRGSVASGLRKELGWVIKALSTGDGDPVDVFCL